MINQPTSNKCQSVVFEPEFISYSILVYDLIQLIICQKLLTSIIKFGANSVSQVWSIFFFIYTKKDIWISRTCITNTTTHEMWGQKLEVQKMSQGLRMDLKLSANCVLLLVALSWTFTIITTYK